MIPMRISFWGWAKQVILLMLLGVLLVWRFRVAGTRFFDVDEFTHIHWAAAIARGSKPYIDFFTFFTPGYYWFLTPLFWLFGSSTFIFLAARYVGVGIFLGILALVGTLFAMRRNVTYALLPAVLLAFLPMPYDKFLEIRPDNLATLLGLAGVVLEVFALTHTDHKHARKIWFFSGISYAVSLVVLVKMLPFAVVGIAIALIDSGLFGGRIATPRHHALFFLGFAMPLFIFVAWALTLGDLSRVIYSLGRMPFETNTVGQVYIMEPHLFFFPNVSFYGGWGITAALILNHALWVIGILVGVYRFFTPYIQAQGNRKIVLAEALIATIFVLSVVGYVNFFPLKHSQYLIPIAVFIAFYAADGVALVLSSLFRVWGNIPVVALLAIGAYVLWQQTGIVNQGKLALSNARQLEEIAILKTTIPPSAAVFDLEGRMIYWRDPYYICCLPMGLFVRFMTRPPALLAAELESKRVPYIWQGESGRLYELPDLAYIKTHYTPVSNWNERLWKRNE